jgi:hypothetical protein
MKRHAISVTRPPRVEKLRTLVDVRGVGLLADLLALLLFTVSSSCCGFGSLLSSLRSLRRFSGSLGGGGGGGFAGSGSGFGGH